jgi:hypothetical protein
MDKHNLSFMADALKFTQKHVIADTYPENYAWGVYKPPINKQGFAATALGSLATSKVLKFDLVPQQYKGVKNMLLRPLLRDMVSEDLRRQFGTLVDQLPLDPQHPVMGYYCPFLTGKPDTIDKIGFVDIPRRNPQYRFTFTGGMNGCALVVAESPAGAQFLRVYHYQNPGRYPAIMQQITQTRGIMIRSRRYVVFKILKAEDYAGKTDREVSGFNFLHFHDSDKKWWIY